MAWTQKKENFCLAYIRLGDASAAYREAYNTTRMKPQSIWKRASELMDDGEVTGRLNELRAPALEKANITVEWIVGNLVEIVKRCMQRAPVEDASSVQIQDDSGNNLWKFDARGANTALQTLAKYKGMLTEKKEITLTEYPQVQIYLPAKEELE